MNIILLLSLFCQCPKFSINQELIKYGLSSPPSKLSSSSPSLSSPKLLMCVIAIIIFFLSKLSSFTPSSSSPSSCSHQNYHHLSLHQKCYHHRPQDTHPNYYHDHCHVHYHYLYRYQIFLGLVTYKTFGCASGSDIFYKFLLFCA